MDKPQEWVPISLQGIEQIGVSCYNTQITHINTHVMNRFLARTLLTLNLLALPWGALAEASVQAGDSIAGLGATVRIAGVPAQAALSVQIDTPMETLTVRVTSDSKGEAIVSLKPDATEVAGTYTADVLQGTTLLGSTKFDVLPDSMDPSASELRTLQKHIDADGNDEATIIVTVADRFGNPLSGRPVTLVSSKTSDMIMAEELETDENGQQQFIVSATTPGTSTFRALDLLSGSPLLASVTVTAGETLARGNDDTILSSRSLRAQLSTFGEIDHFDVTIPRTMVAGEEASKVVVRAVDAEGNTVQDYVGTVRFDAPDDPDAVLPALGRYTFKESNLGVKEFPITLKFQTSGEQMLRVTDEEDSTIYGEAVTTVTGGSGHPAAGSTIEITNYKDGDWINSTSIVLQGKGPRLANLIVMGGEDDTEGETSGTGSFSIPVTLSSSQTEFTIRVKDDSGRYDSGPLVLKIDKAAPAISKVTYAPEKPSTGEQLLVRVETEPKLPSVTVALDGQNVNLTEGTTVGTYQGFLTVPAQPGSYQPIVTATDDAGNATEVRTMFEAGKGGLPQVQGVVAEPKTSSVLLKWQQLESGADGYRVYVGETAENFAYSLDTGRDVGQATIAGLGAGKLYYFAVTALKGDQESSQKSDIVQARVLGLQLEVTPQDASLVLKWPDLANQIPLASYILEYGVEEGKYTEHRLLSGEAKTMTLRDLLNGVTYYLRLTPVTITGDRLNDLSAMGSGTPNGQGYGTGLSDPIPFDPSNPLITTKPGTLNQTGLSSIFWYAALLIAVAGGLAAWMHQRNVRRSAAFLKLVQSQYHGS